MLDELYAFERYRGYKIFVTEHRSPNGQVWAIEIINIETGEELEYEGMRYSIVSGMQALDQAKSHIDYIEAYNNLL